MIKFSSLERRRDLSLFERQWIRTVGDAKKEDGGVGNLGGWWKGEKGDVRIRISILIKDSNKVRVF